MQAPPDEVLDLFAVPGSVKPLPGGSDDALAGDLVLSPGHEPATHAVVCPLLARLAVKLDEDPTRRRRDLRVAMPVPARDGSWVVRGWAAFRHEQGMSLCRDQEVLIATGRVWHARLASQFIVRPGWLDGRDDRWTRAEELAFGAAHTLLATAAGLPGAQVVRRAERMVQGDSPGREQLVHTDLAANVLIDGAGAPVVRGLAPAWRSVVWAEALIVVDSLLANRGDADLLAGWLPGDRRQAMLRALIFRALTAQPRQLQGYDYVLSELETASR